MLDIEISKNNREKIFEEKSVFLGFNSKKKERIIIKDVIFYTDNNSKDRNKYTEITPVILGDGEVTRRFDFPNPDVKYSKMEFLIKQAGTVGWKVVVDFADIYKEPSVEKSSFQVL